MSERPNIVWDLSAATRLGDGEEWRDVAGGGEKRSKLWAATTATTETVENGHKFPRHPDACGPLVLLLRSTSV